MLMRLSLMMHRFASLWSLSRLVAPLWCSLLRWLSRLNVPSWLNMFLVITSFPHSWFVGGGDRLLKDLSFLLGLPRLWLRCQGLCGLSLS